MAGKQKFATQVDSDLLAQVRAIGESEGRLIQSVIEEALTDLVEKKTKGRPRRHVMALYQDSLEQFGPLYERLAK